MKLVLARVLVLGLIASCVCAGCKSSAVKDAGNTEKDKEQAGIDNRNAAVDKMANSAGGN